MYKPLTFAFLIFICLGCSDDPSKVDASDCEYIHSIGLSVEPLSESILVNYSFSNIAFAPIDPTPDPELSCEPETIELFISTDGDNFISVAFLEKTNGSYLIENLQDCEFTTVKIEGSHPDLPTVSATKTVLVGEVPLPQLVDNPLAMENFTLAGDGDQFIFNTTSDNWYLSALSNPSKGPRIFEDVFNTSWNPSELNKVAGVENILVQILPNLNGISSKYLVEYDLNTGEKETLHEITDHWDYNNDVYSPELYWIHTIHYSLDGQRIYFMSNKDNGGSSIFDQKVYDNIWKLDLTTKEIEAITDFLPLEFDLIDFVEDPVQKGNFYISGGQRNVEVVTEDNVYYIDRVDIHYFNAADKSITPIFISDEETEYLSINPTGENLVFSTTNSGKSELRNLNILTQKQQQLTYSDTYRPIKRTYRINWISPKEFITNVTQDGELKFATFRID